MIINGDKVEVGSDNYRVFVGQEVGLMYGYVCDGMYTFDGLILTKQLSVGF